MNRGRTARLLAERIAAEWGASEASAPATNTTSLSEIFAEQPPLLDEFVRSPKYLNLPKGLSPIQFDLVRHFEQVLFPETYALMAAEWDAKWAPVRYVNSLIGCWGKGSGKDLCIQIAFARTANLLLCLQNPQEYYGLAHNTIIHFLNVAYSAPQAHAAFFKPMRNLFVASPFFKDRFEEGQVPGPQATTIRLEKQIELVSGHSDADSLEGKNLLVGVADEVSAFPTNAVTRTGKAPSRNADDIVEMLDSSASTRFPITHKIAQISYPRSRTGDPILKAVKEGLADIEEEGDASVFYVSGPHRTWEVNPIYSTMPQVTLPGMTYSVPNAPRIVRDYKKSRAFARAKYECDPEDAVNAYFKDRAALDRVFSTEFVKPPLEVQYSFGVDPLAGESVPVWQANFVLNDLHPKPGALYAIHADMALNGDRAGVAMAHVKEWVEVETSEADGTGTRIERRPVVVVDFATAFEADAQAVTPNGEGVEREIQMRWFRKLVQFLSARGFAVHSVSQDGWQSVDSLQILATQGFTVQRLSTDRDATLWKTLQDVIYEGRLIGPKHALLCTELQALDRRPNGKVDHPPGGSKDIADAVACAVAQSVVLGGQEIGVGDMDLLDFAAVSSRGAHDDPFAQFGEGGGMFGSSSDYPEDGFSMTASGSWPAQ